MYICNIYICIYITRCYTVQHISTHCSTLQQTTTHKRLTNITHQVWSQEQQLQHAAAHCNTLQQSVTHCKILQHTAAHTNDLLITGDTQVWSRAQQLLERAPELFGIVPNAVRYAKYVKRHNTLQHTATHTATSNIYMCQHWLYVYIYICCVGTPNTQEQRLCMSNTQGFHIFCLSHILSFSYFV